MRVFGVSILGARLAGEFDAKVLGIAMNLAQRYLILRCLVQ